MWPADAATGPHHEVRENEGLLSTSATAVGREKKEAKERWYSDAKIDIRNLDEARSNDSSTAQRRAYPGYTKLETRAFAGLDWRDVTIVSFILLFCTYIQCRPLPFPLLHAGSLSAHSTIVLIQFYCSSSFIIVESLLTTSPTFSIFRCQATYSYLSPQLLHSSAFATTPQLLQHLVFCRPTDDSTFRTICHLHKLSQLRSSQHVRQSWLLSALLRFF